MRLVRWIQDLRPHTRVALVAVMLVAGGVALLVVSLGRFATVGRSSDDLYLRSLPARAQLVKVDESLELTTYGFNKILLEPTGAAQVVALEKTRTQLSVTETEWNRFKELSLHRPGEEDLWRRFEAAQLEQRKLAGPVGLGLIVGFVKEEDPAGLFADPTFIALRDTQRQMSDIVRELEHDMYDPLVDSQLDTLRNETDRGVRDLWISYGVVLSFSSIVGIVAFRSARANERARQRTSHRQRTEAERNELETRLYRALEMAHTEEAAFSLVAQALTEALPPGQAAEMLVSDSSVAHFRQVVTTDPVHHGPGCPVVSPADCPAALRGNSIVFASSTALDACPFLRERSDESVAAACHPVSIAGKSVGVIHTTFPEGLPGHEESLVSLELIARRTGERVGMLRAFAESEMAARSDPLTGLLNRRSLENATRRLEAEKLPYAVAYGDLDHFKQLNDTYGHDVGDRALRLFSRAVRDAVRPADLVCRYGGEEFVIVLPDCTIDAAVPVVERVRTMVADIGTSGRVPSFTISFGLASSVQADTFERVVALADAALSEAKRDGRNRVVVAEGAWRPAAVAPVLVPRALPAPEPSSEPTPGSAPEDPSEPSPGPSSGDPSEPAPDRSSSSTAAPPDPG